MEYNIGYLKGSFKFLEFRGYYNLIRFSLISHKMAFKNKQLSDIVLFQVTWHIDTLVECMLQQI